VLDERDSLQQTPPAGHIKPETSPDARVPVEYEAIMTPTATQAA
jgi:hypothetical protein